MSGALASGRVIVARHRFPDDIGGWVTPGPRSGPCRSDGDEVDVNIPDGDSDDAVVAFGLA
jgi:hypothetical protein